MWRLARATRSRIDLVIDGLDEAEPCGQEEISALLTSLPPGGLVVVGTQDVGAAKAFTNRVIIEDHVGPGDASALIGRFAAMFRESERLVAIGRDLEADHWRDALVQRTNGHLWILTEFLTWVKEQDGAGWPDSPEGMRLAPTVGQYCDLILDEIKCSVRENGRDEDNRWNQLETFLISLGVLDNRPWLIRDVMALRAGTAIQAEDSRKIRSLVSDHAARLVALSLDGGDRIQFRDGYFQDHLRGRNREDAYEIAERLVTIVEDSEGYSYSRDLINYAVERSARHLIEDAEADAGLAAKLLFNTRWLPRRLDTLTKDPLQVDEFLQETAILRNRVAGARPADQGQIHNLDALYVSLLHQRIRLQHRRDLIPQWWAALDATPWSGIERWKPNAEVPQPLAPACHLLVPHGGYSHDSSRIIRPTDVAELRCVGASRRVVLACRGGLEVYDLNAAATDPLFVPLGFDPVQMGAIASMPGIMRPLRSFPSV